MNGKLEFVHTRLVKDTWLSPEAYVTGPSDAVLVFRDLLGDLDREMCAVINVSTSGQVINASFVSMGTISASIVSPPEVFRSALLSGASSVVVLHNHPSGNLTPSQQDRAAAKRLACAGRIVGIEVNDFLIITDKASYSFREKEPACLDPEDGRYDYPTAADSGNESILEEDNAVHYAYERLKQERRNLVTSVLEKIRSGEAFFSPLWSSLAMSPRNPISSAVYRGGNRLILMNKAIDACYKDPRWMTYNQLSGKGYAVRKGEKGIRLEKWIFSRQEKETDESGRTVYKEVPLSRPFPCFFTVYNAQQVIGFPEFDREWPLYRPSGGAESIALVDALLQSSECPIHEVSSDRAFYRPEADEIFLPPRGIFRSLEAFAHTATHEMTHSTGHGSRLNRTFGKRDPFRGPDANYCMEELRAELGSLFLTSDLGLMDPDFDITNSAGYMENYLDQITGMIEEDPNILFRAASDAEKASAYLRNNLEKHLALEKRTEEVPDYERTDAKEACMEKEPPEAVCML